MSQISLIKLGPGNPLYWPTFKEHISSLIIEALLLLRQRNDLFKDEFNLNRLLYFCIEEANLNFRLPMPSYDARNPPHFQDKKKAERENNRPDFYWTLMDHQASNECYRTFLLECKRLDIQSEKSSWKYTEQYVISGIHRFFLEEKGYGKGCEAGAMAGYVQGMELDTILSEINLSITSNKSLIPELTAPREGWHYQDINQLSHSFQRSYTPFNFFLQHFWIDMRDCQYLEQKETKKSGKGKSQKGSKI